MNAGIYIRVSTEDQHTDLQKQELIAIAQKRDWQYALYEDFAMSGAKQDRPSLARLLGDCQSGAIQVVLAYKLDRLGRSTQHLAGIINTLLECNAGLCVPSQGIDTSAGSINPASKLQLNVLAAVAEFERDLIRERTKSGMKAAKARGIHVGRRATYTDHHRSVAKKLLACGPLTLKKLAPMVGLPITTTWRMLKTL